MRYLVALVGLLIAVPSSATVKLFNDGSCSVGVYAGGVSFQGIITAGSSGDVLWGSGYTYDIYPNNNSPYYRVGPFNNGSEWRLNQSGCTTNGWTISTNGVTPPATNYCVYPIHWCNTCPAGTPPRVATFQAMWTSGPNNGQMVNLHPEDSSWSFQLVWPGSCVDFYYTNYVGAGTECATMLIGDSREGACANDGNVGGTIYTNSPMGTNSGSGTGGVNFPGTGGGADNDGIDDRPDEGSNTNAVERGDIGELGDRLIQALGNVEWEIWMARTNQVVTAWQNATNIIGQSRVDLTNLLAGITNSSTNIIGQAHKDWTNRLEFGSQGSTNAWIAVTNRVGGAGSEGSNAWASGRSALQNSTNGLSLVAGSGSSWSPDWTIDYNGYEIDFNPFSRWPELGTMSRWAWGFYALFVFVTWAGKQIWQVVGAYGSMETGGVPNMEVQGSFLGIGGGGNFIGMALAIGVPIVIVGIITTGVVAASSAIVSYFSSHVGTYFSGASVPASFWYIAEQLLPVGLIFGLGTARMVLPWVLNAIVGASMAVVRLLPGK